MLQRHLLIIEITELVDTHLDCTPEGVRSQGTFDACVSNCSCYTRDHPDVSALVDEPAIIAKLPSNDDEMWRAIDPLFSVVVCGILCGHEHVQMLNGRMDDAVKSSLKTVSIRRAAFDNRSNIRHRMLVKRAA